MSDFVRPDFLLSNWLFVWFLIYYFVPLSPFFKKYANPLLALWLGLIQNIMAFPLSFFLFPNIWKQNIWIKLVLMLFLLKIIPIYLLSNRTILWKNDILVFIFVFFVYNFYLFLNHTNPFKVYNKVIQNIARGKNKSPFFYLFSLLFQEKNKDVSKTYLDTPTNPVDPNPPSPRVVVDNSASFTKTT
jgi:hypothetical protein